ncbi:hypothetical protein ANTRET_LOCUS46 [Anthophora retusa]
MEKSKLQEKKKEFEAHIQSCSEDISIPGGEFLQEDEPDDSTGISSLSKKTPEKDIVLEFRKMFLALDPEASLLQQVMMLLSDGINHPRPRIKTFWVSIRPTLNQWLSRNKMSFLREFLHRVPLGPSHIETLMTGISLGSEDQKSTQFADMLELIGKTADFTKITSSHQGAHKKGQRRRRARTAALRAKILH